MGQFPSPSADPIDELRHGLSGRSAIERDLGAGGIAIVVPNIGLDRGAR